MAKQDTHLVISCEHASNTVPPCFEWVFPNKSRVLASHRGYDVGAAVITDALAQRLSLTPVCGEITRLLIDINRSLGNPTMFSPYAHKLAEAQREQLIKTYYLPHCKKLAAAIDRGLRGAEHVLHVAIHSFTPWWDGIRRDGEMGILYDPEMKSESRFAMRMKRHLTAAGYHTRLNFPYHGRDDSLCHTFRGRYGDRYSGIEIEVNNIMVRQSSASRRVGEELAQVLESSLVT